MSFQQLFVYCQLCHQRWHQQEPLHLTSCAHILCKKHLQNHDNRPICPVCSSQNISSLTLNDDRLLPDDVKLFFQPLPNFIETLHQITQFQYNGLINQIQYYQSHCIKLREKIARQQQLLYQAKEELDTIPQLKSEISQLETMLKNKQNVIKGNSTNSKISQIGSRYSDNSNNFFQLKNNSNGNNGHNNNNSGRIRPPKPMTVDLTDDDDDTFVTKLKNSNSLKQRHLPLKVDRAKTIDLHTYKPQRLQNSSQIEHVSQVNPLHQSQIYKDKSGLSLNQIIADSTHINKKNIKKTKTFVDSSSPSLIHTSSGGRSSSRIIIGSPQDKNNDSYVLTPPTLIDNKIRNSRMHFPTPLEKLRINKRHNTTTTTDRLQNMNPLSKRSTTQQLQIANSNQTTHNFTRNNNSYSGNLAQKRFRSIK